MEGQPAEETPSGIPYIGSLIALTSASGQRYRGTLYTVDLNESTIALQNVTLGADDPPTGPVYEFIKFRGSDISELTVLANGPAPEAVPQAPAPASAPQQSLPQPAPGGAVRQHATAGGAPIAPAAPQFTGWSHQPGPARGGAPPQQPQQPPPPPPPQHIAGNPARAPAPTVLLTPAAPPRAPVQAPQPQPQLQGQGRGPQQQPRPQQPPLQPPQQGQARQQANGAPHGGRARGEYGRGAGRGGRGGRAVRGGEQEPRSAAGAPGRGGRGRGGRGSAGGPLAGRGPPGELAAAARPENMPRADFDFEAALSKFNKADVEKETEQGGDEEAEAPLAPSSSAKYEKDDFFDTMSCEALERMKLAEAQQDGAPRIDGRTRAAGQRKVDMETFGEVHQGGRLGGRRRGRGYGRSGRGGPGRGRGGRGGPQPAQPPPVAA